jgi:hypothetical protein
VEAERKRERERERERGPGRGVEQRSGVSSVRQRPDHGARGRRVAARQWRATGSVRRGRRGWQVRVNSWVRCGEAVGAALIGGVGSTVRPIRFSNRIKLISNGFKFAPNFDRFKRCLPVLQKFQIKYV